MFGLQMLAFGLIIAGATILNTVHGYRCPGPEWTPRRNSSYCYLLVHRSESGSERRSWREAEAECTIRGGYLTDLENSAELYRPGYKTQYWIGLTYETGQWRWTGANRPFQQGDMGDFNPDSSFQSTGTSIFDPQSKLARGYIEIDTYNSEWVLKITNYFSADAEADMNYICKAKYSSRPLCKTEDGWAYYNGRCLKMYTNSETSALMTSWNEAASICLAEGAHIIVPNTPAETDFLTNWMLKYRVKEAWIGLTVTKDSSGFNPALVAWEDDTAVTSSNYTSPWIAIGSSNITTILINLSSGKQHCAIQDIKSEMWISGGYTPKPQWRIGAQPNECENGQKAFACETDMEVCPYGWSHYGQYCYQIRGSESDLRTWNDASTECQNQGGHLAIIQNVFIQKFLEARISALGLEVEWSKTFWFGYSSFGTGVYSWVSNPDNLTSRYTNWGPGQPLPAVPGKPFCGRMGAVNANPSSVRPLLWQSTICGVPSNFICQARPSDALQMDAVHEPLKCDPPFVLYHERCYWFSTDLVTWDAARSACSQTNSVLVQLDSMAENTYLRDQVITDVWIGFRIIRPDPNFDSNSYLQYADGRNVSDTDYKNLGQQNVEANSYCMIMEGPSFDYYWGKWFARPCGDSRRFICSHRGEPAPPKPEPNFFYPECGENWVLIGDQCYKLNFELLDFGLALQMCHSQAPDSQMLYITSPEEERAVLELLNGQRDMISPLMTNDSSYWTALQVTSSDQWSWKGRSGQTWELPVAYTNFASNAQFDWATAYSPYCLALKASGGGWMPELCKGQLRYSVCKKPGKITKPPVSATTPLPFEFTYGCPKGWQHHGTSCFQRNSTSADWTSAQEACRKQQGYLAAIASEAQMQQMKDIVKDAWIGLNSKASPVDPRVYRNDDGSTVLYTPWADQISRPGKPNPADADCVAALTSTIDAYACITRKPFVCMLPEVKLELLPPECVTPPQDTGCRRWGYGYKDSCLYMGNDASNPSGQREMVTFEEARATCRKHFDADLVVINNAEKQEFIAHLIGQWSSDYWIALREDEMPWNAFKKWVTGANVEYTNWAHSEPHVSQGNLGCVALVAVRGDLHNPGEWYVNPCSSYKFALCEGKRQGWTPPTPAPTPFVNGCPKDWRTADLLSKNCYKLFDPLAVTIGIQPPVSRLTWQEAENFCIGYRGHLASVDSLSEQQYIRNLLPYQFGSPNEQKDNFWIGLKEKDQTWAWSDGTVYGTNTQFHSTTDHSTSDIIDCVAMETNTGSWIKQNCLLSWGWVCEVPKGLYTEGEELPTMPPAIEITLTCGVYSARGDWFYHPQSDSCFFVSRFQDSWKNSQQFCNEIESNLASVEASQHDFLTMVISKQAAVNTQFWIGLRLRDPSTNQHAWVDGSNSHFRAWAQGEPHPYGVEGCVSMDNRNGKWRDEVCGVNFEFVCKKSKTPIIATPTPLPSSGVTDTWGCPTSCPTCVPFRDSCYYFSSPLSQADWNNAHATCGYLYMNEEDHTKSSQLLSIHDALEQSFVVAHMGKDRANRWMGLFEDRQKKGWFYTDDTPFDYTNWDFKEPVPYPQESLCVYILGDAGRAGAWNDHFCRDKYPYVCKMKKDAKFPVSVQQSTKCPTGFRGIGDACFKVVSLPTGSNTWENAKTVCSRDPGARIATVVNVYENAELHVLLAEKVKFANDSTVNAWIGVLETKGGLSWPVSGCLPTYNNIKDFYAAPTTDSTTCGAISYDGTWHTSPCSANNLNYAVCEIRTPECPKKPESVNGTCPDGFAVDCGGSFCYKVQLPNATSDKSYTWNEAKTACAAMNGSLASVRNEGENTCLQKWVEHSTGAWIGLTEIQQGFSWPYQYQWTWLDPEVQFGSFSNWAPGKPSGQDFSREPCVEMGSDGKWYNWGCSGNHQHPRGFVCEVQKIVQANETCGVSSERGEWFYHSPSDSCFFVSRIQDAWRDAQESCNALGAHLATVEATQQDFLSTVLAKQASIKTQFWIGLRLRDPSTNQHAWIDGSNSHFRAWASGEPHPYGVEACVSMDSSTGKWKDEVCGVNFEYVCKKSRTPIVPTVSPQFNETVTWGCPTSCPTCIPFRDSCYFFSSSLSLADWTNAHATCTFMYQDDQDPSKNSHLLSIHDDLEQSFVVAQMAKDRVNRWMGLFEDRQKNGWFYSDDTPFDYSNWDFNEPIPYPPEPLCVYILGEAGRAGRWNDHFCRDQNAYVCKMKKDAKFPVIAPQPSTKCPAGFTEVGDACFQVVELPAGSTSSWENGNVLCGGMSGAGLATVMNVYENAQIHVLLVEKAKFSNAPSTEAWIGLRETKGNLEWPLGGCLPTYNNIREFYSLPTTEGYTCGAMSQDGTWHTSSCTTNKKYAVCEIREPACPTHPEPVNGFCPEGTSIDCSGNFCYKVELPTDTKNYTWTEAKEACQAINGSLASIRNEEENKCLQRWVEHSTGAWIGLVEEQMDMWQSRYEWKWMDPDVQIGNFNNWAPGKPGISWPRDACVEMRNDGKWVNMACSGYVQHPRGYICEVQKVLTTSATSTVSTVLPPYSSSLSTQSTRTTGPTRATSSSATTVSTTRSGWTGTTPSSTRPSVQTKETIGDVQTTTVVPYSGGISTGGLIGIGITVAVLVPMVTLIGYLFWRRKTTGQPILGRGGATADSEKEAVIQHEEHESYT